MTEVDVCQYCHSALGWIRKASLAGNTLFFFFFKILLEIKVVSNLMGGGLARFLIRGTLQFKPL